MKRKPRNNNIIRVTGRKYVLEALKNVADQVKKIIVPYSSKGQLVDDILAAAAEHGIDIAYDQKRNLQFGITAVVEKKEMMTLQELYEQNGLYVAIDGVFDPHNLGAVIRSAYAFGVDAVILPARGSCGLTDAVVRTSAGAALYTNIIYTNNFTQAIHTFKKRGFDIIGTSADSKDTLQTYNEMSPNTIIIFGNEEKGLKNSIDKLCTHHVKIDMNNIESLNLSVSAGIVLYHFSKIKK